MESTWTTKPIQAGFILALVPERSDIRYKYLGVPDRLGLVQDSASPSGRSAIDSIAWINSGMAELVRITDRFPEFCSLGILGYEDL